MPLDRIKMRQFEDIEILQGCKRKDPKFERLLLQKYAAILMTVGRRYARSQAEAEDVLQDAYIKIFENLEQYQPAKGSLLNWMRSIVIRTALRDYRRKFPSTEGIDIFQKSEKGVPEVATDQLAEEELLSLIAELPKGYREVFNLFVIDGYSHKEIGTLLDISESTSRSQLTRAKKILKKKIIAFKKSEKWSATALAMILKVG